MTPARLTLGLAVLAASPAWAQNYEISWWTVDGGGAMGSAGGSYELGATAGQPDAGGPFVGSPYALHSGFWAIAAGGLGPQADLSITKTDGQASAVPGEPVTYTIVAANAGPSPASNATVTDTPPAALTGVTWTCTATPGSSCPPSGSGAIGASVSLLVGGTATFSLIGTIAPGATGTLVNTASIGVPPGVTDPDVTDNQATDTDTLTPEADLSLAKSDSPDPVAVGGLLTYTIIVTNQGPSTSPSMTITDPLPASVGFVSATPGAPTCTHASGTVTCGLGALAPGANTNVTIQVVVGPTPVALGNTATVTGGATDPLSTNNADTEATTVVLRAEGELVHGTRLRADLAGVGPAADVDLYRLRQQPYASYEVVVDEAAGDVGAGSGPSLDRVGPDGSTVLQSSLPVGVGSARSLRFANTTSLAIDAHFVRVRSASCGSDCGPDDTYRLRAWETTASIPRFNNSGSQVTVLLLQNASSAPIAGTVYAWDAGGTLAGQQAFDLAPHALLVLNTGALVPGGGGSLTVAHDGPFAALVGKTVALEPATGYSFDSPLVIRSR